MPSTPPLPARLIELGWFERGTSRRSLVLTGKGKSGPSDAFGCPADNDSHHDPHTTELPGMPATGRTDLTNDLRALDSAGSWAVMITCEGEVTCVRFETVREALFPCALGRGRRATPGAGLLGLGHAPWRGAIRRRMGRSCRLAAGRSPRPRRSFTCLASGGVVESRPIKGTGRTLPGLLPNDYVVIVDMVRNDLGRVVEPGSVTGPALSATEQHPGLYTSC